MSSFVFFFKQKTAYEMRISDWSSDVCSSDLGRNTAIDGSTNIANLERVADTLDTSQCSFDAGAAIPCADYLGFGDLSKAVQAYILFTSRDTGGHALATVTADLTGRLAELPAAPLSFATGVVYRQDKGWRDPDTLTVMGLTNTKQPKP